MVEDGGNAKAKSAPGRETRRSISIKAEKKSIKKIARGVSVMSCKDFFELPK